MAIFVNIGKAKTMLPDLISASIQGEEVIICSNGVPKVRLIPVMKPQIQTEVGRLYINKNDDRIAVLPPDVDVDLIR